MANAYVCDACGVTITDPHKVKMKEFYVGCDYELFGTFPVDSIRKTKVHLCDECYKGLKMAARNLSKQIVSVETNFYDKEEIFTDCTVQVLTNTATGEVSVGWWKNAEK